MLAALIAVALLLSGPTHARLSVPDTSPFTVHGTGFKPSEQVTLNLTSGNRLTRVVTADTAGRFTRRVILFKLKDESCPAYTVTARGTRGSVAVLKVVPMCANIQPVDQ